MSSQESPNCKVCGAPSRAFADATLLQRYKIAFYRCPACGFVQTEEPYWLAEAYSEAYAFTDIGAVSRNHHYRKVVAACISSFFVADGPFLDYGGGYGLFTRLMRDMGFNFYTYDKYGKNLFAPGFDGDASGSTRYELLTAFEVFEHLVDPIGELGMMSRISDNILFSTVLLPSPAPRPDEWWYYGLDHGQHVSLYSPDSLHRLAARCGMRAYSNGHNLHLFSRSRRSERLFRWVTRPWIANILAAIRRRASLVDSDFALMKDRARQHAVRRNLSEQSAGQRHATLR